MKREGEGGGRRDFSGRGSKSRFLLMDAEAMIIPSFSRIARSGLEGGEGLGDTLRDFPRFLETGERCGDSKDPRNVPIVLVALRFSSLICISRRARRLARRTANIKGTMETIPKRNPSPKAHLSTELSSLSDRFLPSKSSLAMRRRSSSSANW